MNTKETSTSPAGEGVPARLQDTVSAATSQNSRLHQAYILIPALWRSPKHTHFVAELDKLNQRFRNHPVKAVSAAISRLPHMSGSGRELYFAPAEFASPDSREAKNAVGAFGFWMDIDCGALKAAANKGYATVEEAMVALTAFCKSAGLPGPTHLVHTGGGLHAHWTLDAFLGRHTWQAYARKLKRLTHALGLLADDSRTADVASVLRIPGTMNYKYDPPREVRLLSSSEQFIELASMLQAIDNAFEKHCPVPSKTDSTQQPAPIIGKPGGGRPGRKLNDADLARLTYALVWLDPDCDDETWKLRRLAPLALAARQNPDLADDLRYLAKVWSSGELRGSPSKAWSEPGSNGRTGAEVFDEVWGRFLTVQYQGNPVTIGTIYHDAKAEGWDGQGDQFEIVATEIVGDVS